jgi:transglutaminase-like putative cysteine protease
MRLNPTRLRPAPIFLSGATLLVWGWQNNLLPYALIMALLLEAPRWVHWRWQISDVEFNRLSDLSGVIFFLCILYIFNAKGPGGIYVILSILPFVLFLLLLAQRYSVRGAIRLSSLFISLRRLERRAGAPQSAEIDLSLPYCMICLLSASAGNIRTIWFFVSVCGFLGITLWCLRPGRYGVTAWFSLLAVAILAAFTAQTGVRELQSLMERQFLSFFDQYMWRYRDPDRTTTSIGMLGRLKFSDRIMVRIATDEPLRETLYLREATYNTYGYGVWSAGITDLSTIDPDKKGNSWTLNPGRSIHTATVSTYLMREDGVVPLPLGASRVWGKGVIGIEQNRYATVKMEFREGWISYQTGYDDTTFQDTPPDHDDLYLSSSNREDFERLARELELTGKPPETALRVIKDYFTRNFLYSISPRQRYPRGGYLHDFLFSNRQGHCEYFATATVLLLRAAGIPARYAVGFATREYSELEGLYLARSRHAHAWTMAWTGDRWQILDTTPANWAPLEDEMAPDYQPLLDVFAWLRYKYQMWRAEDIEAETENDLTTLLWLLIPLGILLGWRLWRKDRVRQAKAGAQDSDRAIHPGMDSEFFSVLALLNSKGRERRPGETALRWIKRVKPAAALRGLEQSLHLHYRYRFDPTVSDEQSRHLLRSLVAELLPQLRRLSRL